MNFTNPIESASNASAVWTPWQPLEPALVLSASSLAETLDGGQAFRWNREDAGTWRGQWSRFAVRLRLDPRNRLQWSGPVAQQPELPAALRRYLGLDDDLDSRVDGLPWRSDPHLARAVGAFPGLRLLRQPLSETLLAFLCSATKQIVQIKRMLALLAERFGDDVLPGIRTLPDWKRLDEVAETDLRRCALGFRARYIKAVAARLAPSPEWTGEVERLPYPEARQWLMRLPGVGEKVADCVLLFGAGKFEAFPVDVWILKTMRQRYGLEDWSPSQVAQFGRIHFGADAGLAQQFLFARERREFSRRKETT